MTLLATDDGIRLYCEDLADEMNALDVPTLVAAGDDDDPCLEPAWFMKQHIRSAALVLLPIPGMR